MKVLITGAHGFIGKNLGVHLIERKEIDLVEFGREDSLDSLCTKLVGVDFVFHLAGVNRPKDIEEFTSGNGHLTSMLCQAIIDSDRKIPIIYTSSVQAAFNNPYGQSKRSAEQILMNFSEQTGCPVYIFRLPNVFGKWCKPNYNSVVATFCHNIARDLPVQINNATDSLRLVYIDDVVKTFISIMDGAIFKPGFVDINPVFEETVGGLAEKIYKYKESRLSLISEPVGTGFDRALYSTYLSYLKPDEFSYEVEEKRDKRGAFVEFLKTKDSGQFSYFTAHPGITRGEHYHHTKSEKFVVLKGNAVFRFRHILTGESYEVKTVGDLPQVVETIPGWAHSITNIGNQDLVVLLWANEIFDPNSPDTYANQVCG